MQLRQLAQCCRHVQEGAQARPSCWLRQGTQRHVAATCPRFSSLAAPPYTHRAVLACACSHSRLPNTTPQEELEAYDKHQRKLEDALDQKTAELIALRRAALEHASASPMKVRGGAGG